MAKLNPIPRPTALTTAQAALLAAAVQRQDGAIVLPERLKGNARTALAASLIAKGLVREVRARVGLSACRQDAETGKFYALTLTKAGRVAAMMAGETERAVAERSTEPTAPIQPGGSPQRSESEASGTVPTIQSAGEGSGLAATPPLPRLPASRSTPRPDTKLSHVIVLLEREAGATIDDLVAATGWLPHTTRAALTGLRKRGFAVARVRQHGAETTYRIQPAPAAEAA